MAINENSLYFIRNVYGVKENTGREDGDKNECLPPIGYKISCSCRRLSVTKTQLVY
jgi:hypothetical protein